MHRLRSQLVCLCVLLLTGATVCVGVLPYLGLDITQRASNEHDNKVKKSTVQIPRPYGKINVAPRW